MDRDEQLTIKQTQTGYWIVQRDGMQVASAMTHKGAEAERDLLRRLSRRRVRRTARPPRSLARRAG